MALPPKYAGQKYTSEIGVTAQTTHTIELYLDYVCPFSKKLFETLHQLVLPSPTYRTTHSTHVSILLRQQIQPWHPSSTLVHEAALASLKLAPHRFWDVSAAIFARQREFFDESTSGETRNETYERLAGIVGEAAGVEKEKVMEILRVRVGGEVRNAGNGVTDDLKLITKMNRLTGVHVTPTVLFNGVVEQSISSSWTKEQWEEWLDKNIV
jgi:protein-disulfide isomerase